MTSSGSLDYDGNIFAIDTNGVGFTDMTDFTGFNGKYPTGDLIMLNSKIYGMAPSGGANSAGVVFKIDSNAVASINEIRKSDIDVNLFPNPNKGVFTIQTSDFSGQFSVQVYNMFGEKIYEQLTMNTGKCRINLSDKPSGVYLYRVISKSSEPISEGKFIIE